jgi:hypothetical protein
MFLELNKFEDFGSKNPNVTKQNRQNNMRRVYYMNGRLWTLPIPYDTAQK